MATPDNKNKIAVEKKTINGGHAAINMIVMQLDFEKNLLTGGVGAVSLIFPLFKVHPPALHRPGSNFVKVTSK